MSGGASEEDLDDVDIPEDEYLFEIVERAPASSSLLNVMREMPIYRGFVEFATDPGKPRPGMLTKVETKRLLSQEHVDWESLHTRLLEQIFLFRATSKSTTGTKTTGLTDARFKLHGKLAREFPPFLEDASKEKRERWTSAIDALAIDFARLLDDRLVKGGGELSFKIDSILEGDWKPEGREHEEPIYYIAHSNLLHCNAYSGKSSFLAPKRSKNELRTK